LDDSDEGLMIRAGMGERAACQLLVERHLGRVLTFARRILGDREEAEDAAQEVFLRVWVVAPRWKRGAARFTTWLHRVAMNVCLDRLSKKRESSAEGVAEPVDPRAEPSLAADAAELAHHVGEAVAALPETQRIAVTLCHYQGLSNSEAADVIGVSVEALESILARGRRALRTYLRPVAPALLGRGG